MPRLVEPLVHAIMASAYKGSLIDDTSFWRVNSRASDLAVSFFQRT